MKRFLLILLFLNAIVCTYSQISFSGILIFNSGRLQISRHISFVGSNQLYIRRISFV